MGRAAMITESNGVTTCSFDVMGTDGQIGCADEHPEASSFEPRLHKLLVISKSSGYLVGHYTASESADPSDGDVVAGMLTAIQAFVGEAFDLDGGEISTIEFGTIEILIEPAEYLYAAAIVSGPDTAHLRAQLEKLLGDIEAEHAEALREWTGSTAFLPTIQQTIADTVHRINAPPPLADEHEGTSMTGGSMGVRLPTIVELVRLLLERFNCRPALASSPPSASISTGERAGRSGAASSPDWYGVVAGSRSVLESRRGWSQ